MELKSPFDIVSNINTSSNDIRFETGFDSMYKPFLINRAFSNHLDTVFFANEINMYPDLSNDAQYLFYFFGLTKSKRYAKSAKKELDDVVDKLASKFNLSDKRMAEYLSMMSPEQVAKLVEFTDEGGMTKSKKKRK